MFLGKRLGSKAHWRPCRKLGYGSCFKSSVDIKWTWKKNLTEKLDFAKCHWCNCLVFYMKNKIKIQTWKKYIFFWLTVLSLFSIWSYLLYKAAELDQRYVGGRVTAVVNSVPPPKKNYTISLAFLLEIE